jgi:E3 ubiquitin-protein ligase BRE1
MSGEGLPSPQHDGMYQSRDLNASVEHMVTVCTTGPARTIPTSLFFEDSQTLRKHLADRKDKVLSALSGLFARFPPASPEVATLQHQLSKLLAAEKEHICELQRVQTEKDQKSERLVTATHRYMIAEKKIDRLKSQQVQKLESAAMASSTTGIKEETSSGSNGVDLANGTTTILAEKVETARNEALAEAAKRKEHIEQLEAENKKLTEDISALNVKLAGLSDDDYAKTDLFKAIKTQHEDVIKRINNLEATNIQLREEAQKYQAERTAYRIKVDDEARATVTESEGAVVQAESNLARIRHSRDELLAKVNMLEQDQKDLAMSRQQTKELMGACESRITALESECERLRLQITEQASAEDTADLDKLSSEELRSKVVALKQENKLLGNELPGMEAAWRKAQAVAGKKITEIATWEENITKANADKAKADQKFFAAMKAKESLEQQLRVLRQQTVKGTEVVAQLKETDSLSRSLVEKMEKQTAEMRAQMDELSVQHRQLQQKFNESAIVAEGHVSQIAELKKVVETKDTTCLASKKAQREAEVEREKMAAQVQGLEKQLDHWKQKSIGNQSAHNAMMEVSLPASNMFEFNANVVRRACFNARSVRVNSRTRSSKHVVMSSATNASKIDSRIAHASAPTAARHLEITTPCAFICSSVVDSIDYRPPLRTRRPLDHPKRLVGPFKILLLYNIYSSFSPTLVLHSAPGQVSSSVSIHFNPILASSVCQGEVFWRCRTRPLFQRGSFWLRGWWATGFNVACLEACVARVLLDGSPVGLLWIYDSTLKSSILA